MKLAIISHTEHYKTEDGTLVGWGATINEINHLLDVFDEIHHIAMFYDAKAPKSALPYQSDKIHFVPIPAAGGRTALSKLKLLWNAPKTISKVHKTLKLVDCFQLRTPTGIGVFLIPFLMIFVKKKGWFKYAGNWNQEQPPIGYRLQRSMLKRQNRMVTINGTWSHQPKHHLSFENPCLSLKDIENGKFTRKKKSFEGPLSFCFVGRLEKEKGVERIIKAFLALADSEQKYIKAIHLVGEGDDFEYFKSLVKESFIKYYFHGALSRQEVFRIYKESHVFLMPTTASEGFPKVIAEAMNFGCIPIVSNISAIGHYIKHQENGFLLDDITMDGLVILLKEVLHLKSIEYQHMINRFDNVVNKFTYNNYNNQIKTKLLK